MIPAGGELVFAAMLDGPGAQCLRIGDQAACEYFPLDEPYTYWY
jgi:hypothetical protein